MNYINSFIVSKSKIWTNFHRVLYFVVLVGWRTWRSHDNKIVPVCEWADDSSTLYFYPLNEMHGCRLLSMCWTWVSNTKSFSKIQKYNNRWRYIIRNTFDYNSNNDKPHLFEFTRNVNIHVPPFDVVMNRNAFNNLVKHIIYLKRFRCDIIHDLLRSALRVSFRCALAARPKLVLNSSKQKVIMRLIKCKYNFP